MDSFFLEGQLTKKNLGQVERMVFAASGAGALAAALLARSRWSIPLALLGGSLVYQGVRGHSFLYQMLDIDRTRGGKGGVTAEQAVTIGLPVEEVYAFWRNFENFPRFMRHVEAVEIRSNTRSHWVVSGPLGTRVEWDAEINGEKDNEFIAWQTLPDASVEHHGLVRFQPAPGGRGTEVRVSLEYYPIGGSTGAAITALLGEEPDRQIREDILRLKQVLETGEVARIEGQPAGNRGMFAVLKKGGGG